MKTKLVPFNINMRLVSCSIKTRRERLKSAPYLRLKKRKTLFLKKIFFQKKSHSAEKCKGGPFWIYFQTFRFVFGKKIFEKRIFEKSRTVPKKIQRGDPLGTSGFVCFLEKVKNERGDPLE